MFDVFDIQVPILVTDAGFEVCRYESTFGPSNDAFVYCNGIKLARVLLANQVYSNMEAWTGSSERADWTVLLVETTANDASTADEAWEAFAPRSFRFFRRTPSGV